MTTIRSILQKLRNERPGRRFRRTSKEAEGARRKLGRPFLVLTGGVLVVAGLFFMAVPGPGLLITLAGLFLISLVSRRMAHLLDRSEVTIHKMVNWLRRRWIESHQGIKLLLIAAGILLTAALVYALLRGLEFLQGT